MDNIQIAIDGPAGAGKSTIAKKLAQRLNITYIDTGAMYRALTYKIITNNVDINDIESINKLIEDTEITILKNDLYLDNYLLDDSKIRSHDVNEKVAHIAQLPEARKKLVALQQKIALNNSVIMDGRDIATHVLPNADIKIYLTASVKERALRRYKELIKKDPNIELESIERSIIERDNIDSKRKYAPLKKDDDAIIIDTTGLGIDEVINKIIDIIKDKKLI
ncbi:MAG: (d)CMP kinase [Clostridiales bacterium]|nr:(d)CMP kinase [Clostridiales bacterium]